MLSISSNTVWKTYNHDNQLPWSSSLLLFWWLTAIWLWVRVALAQKKMLATNLVAKRAVSHASCLHFNAAVTRCALTSRLIVMQFAQIVVEHARQLISIVVPAQIFTLALAQLRFPDALFNSPTVMLSALKIVGVRDASLTPWQIALSALAVNDNNKWSGLGGIVWDEEQDQDHEN